MDEAYQLVPYKNYWNPDAVPAKFKPWWIPNAIAVDSLPSPQLAPTFLPQDFVQSFPPLAAQVHNGIIYVYQPCDIHIDQTLVYVHQPGDDAIVQNTLASLTRLFSCQPDEVIETFADYLCEPNADWQENQPRQEPVTSSAVSLVPSDRQVCTEAAAKAHVIHLETITLAEEQEAPTASAVGQILISGREVWMKLKGKLLSSFSRCLRNRSVVGLRIAFADAAQA